MFRVKNTRRNVKRAVSPLRPATDGAAPLPAEPPKSVIEHVENHSLPSNFEHKINNFFDAESVAVSLSKPWLRLERGLRLQKFRTFASTYPGLTDDEKELLYKTLLKANDSKLLNTKQQVLYENGKISAIRGLKVIRSKESSEPPVFKIEATRGTKKHTENITSV